MTETTLKDRLKHNEGVVKNASGRHIVYIDSLGKETIGYGRLLSRGLSEDEAEYLLRNDIKDSAFDLKRNLPWIESIGKVRYEAIVELVFNIGINNFIGTRMKRGFTNTISALKAGDWNRAADEMLDSRWARQVGNRAVQLSEVVRSGKA